MSKEKVIEIIDKYWRAANYCTVAKMYLKESRISVIDEIRLEDLRDYANGHWGTCPGINFIYAHLNYYIKSSHRKIQLIIGPGHGGNAVLANYEIEGSARYEKIEFPVSSLPNFYASKHCSEIRTELSPYLPGVIYDGGELGYSLACSYGAVIDETDRLCVCIIGDGEMETGTLSASWQCVGLRGISWGKVLPIIHLNGMKMGGKSLVSMKSEGELLAIFRGMGYEPWIIADDYHAKMLSALEEIEQIYQESDLTNKNSEKVPMIILKTPKGWTAPNSHDISIEGTLKAHKDPLRRLDPEKKLQYLKLWLNSYLPEELFDEEGCLKKEITCIIPEQRYRIGQSLLAYKHRKLKLPIIENYFIKGDVKKYRNIKILNDYLREVIKENSKIFCIVSPDELESNLLSEIVKGNEGEDKVIEILNENICQGIMQGYIMTGRNCLMIGYEAFMPIISSMVSQYAKWLFQARKIKWRNKVASTTYLLTSLCWANTYSHQNPEFVNSLLSLQYDFIRIYFPIDANTLAISMNVCLESEEGINLIISSKQEMPQWLDGNSAKQIVSKGVGFWDFGKNSLKNEPDLVIVAIGDYPMRECMAAIHFFYSKTNDIWLRVVFVIELTILGSQSTYPHAISEKVFCDIFAKNVPMIICFHGYSSAIKLLMYERIAGRSVEILGYNNRSVYSANDLQKLIINNCSRFNILLFVYENLYQNMKISDAEYQILKSQVLLEIRKVMTDEH